MGSRTVSLLLRHGLPTVTLGVTCPHREGQ